MERLLALQERFLANQAKARFTEDLAKCQAELPVIPKRGRIRLPGGDVPFAKWEDINERIKPILSKHGFSLNFRIPPPDPATQMLVVYAILKHKDGHQEESCSAPLPADISGKKSPIHAAVSATTYAKRNAASVLLNITTVGEDDDAFAASLNPDMVRIEEVRSLFKLWKDAYGGENHEFDEWVETTCGIKQVKNAAAWRREDMDVCLERIQNKTSV